MGSARSVRIVAPRQDEMDAAVLVCRELGIS
jgi:hypothetical protein